MVVVEDAHWADEATMDLLVFLGRRIGRTRALLLDACASAACEQSCDDLQALLAEHPETFGAGWSLVRREYMTPIGPVDLLCRDDGGACVAVEIKRRGEIDGVEQLTRYLELLNRDPHLAPVRGVFAAQEIKPQARVLAVDRGIGCLVLDYDAMRGHDDVDSRLF